MPHLQKLITAILTLTLSLPAWSMVHRVGVSGGVVQLYGDLDKVSDPGPSIRATYEMLFSRYFHIGIDGGYQSVEGKPWTFDASTSKYVSHPYKTTLLPGGVFARLTIPIREKFMPYLESGAGASLWMSEDNPRPIPSSMKSEWALESHLTVGGGIFLKVGERWGLDVGARGRLYFGDNLDNINDEVLSGKKGADDFTLQGGLSLVYLFGVVRDKDKDGIPDKIDKDPERPEDFDGFQDEDGVPDLDNDGDGIPDIRDRAPNEPEDVDGFHDEDGVPDPDNDGDGIPDAQDGASDAPEDRDGFQDEDGIPDPDNDGDGIPDTEDEFPNIPFKPKEKVPVAPPEKEVDLKTLPFSVQVSAFRTLKGANRDIENYRKRGYEVFKCLEWIPKMGGWYRVYVGHFATKEEAQKTAKELLARGYTNYVKVTKLEKPVVEEPEVGYYIHVTSFKDKLRAQGQVQIFVRAGYQASYSLVDLKEKGVWYRVYVGPYPNKAMADAAAQRIKETGLSSYTAIEERSAMREENP